MVNPPKKNLQAPHMYFPVTVIQTINNNNNRQNSKTTNMQTILTFVSLVLLYGPFGYMTFLSESRKNSGNIGLLKSKPKYSKMS